jgi:hypothetical protein
MMGSFFKAGLLAAVLILPLACGKGDDVQAIRELVDKGAALGEKHDIGGLMKLATEDFLALPGDVDRRSAKAILWRTFQYYGAFKVLYPLPKVAVESDGKKASASLPFLIVRENVSFPRLKDLAQDPKQWLEEVGENADLYALDMKLVKDNGDWLVRGVVLKRFTGRSFRE